MDAEIEKLFQRLRRETPMNDVDARELAEIAAPAGITWDEIRAPAMNLGWGRNLVVWARFLVRDKPEQDARLAAAVVNAVFAACISDEFDQYQKADDTPDRLQRCRVIIDMSAPDWKAKMRAALDDDGVDSVECNFMNVQNGTIFEGVIDLAQIRSGSFEVGNPVWGGPGIGWLDKSNGHPRSPKASRNARKRGKR